MLISRCGLADGSTLICLGRLADLHRVNGHYVDLQAAEAAREEQVGGTKVEGLAAAGWLSSEYHQSCSDLIC